MKPFLLRLVSSNIWSLAPDDDCGDYDPSPCHPRVTLPSCTWTSPGWTSRHQTGSLPSPSWTKSRSSRWCHQCVSDNPILQVWDADIIDPATTTTYVYNVTNVMIMNKCSWPSQTASAPAMFPFPSPGAGIPSCTPVSTWNCPSWSGGCKEHERCRTRTARGAGRDGKVYKIALAQIRVWKISTQNICKKCSKSCLNAKNCTQNTTIFF